MHITMRYRTEHFDFKLCYITKFNLILTQNVIVPIHDVYAEPI